MLTLIQDGSASGVANSGVNNHLNKFVMFLDIRLDIGAGAYYAALRYSVMDRR